MNLLGMLLDTQGSPALKQLTSAFGVSEGEAKNALSALVPALARGMQNNLAQQNGVAELLGALRKGQHQRYIDQPGTLPAEQVTADGNAILGHLFGSKDVSRNVAAKAAESTGLDQGLIKQALPLLAGLAMGALSKQSDAGRSVGGLLPGLLGGGADDEFGLDDVLNLARKFF